MDPVKIVVFQHGFVAVGRLRVKSMVEPAYELTNASIIRYWGTTKGIGELRGGPTSKTKLDPCGTMRWHPTAMIFALDASEEGWASLLC